MALCRIKYTYINLELNIRITKYLRKVFKIFIAYYHQSNSTQTSEHTSLATRSHRIHPSMNYNAEHFTSFRTTRVVSWRNVAQHINFELKTAAVCLHLSRKYPRSPLGNLYYGLGAYSLSQITASQPDKGNYTPPMERSRSR